MYKTAICKNGRLMHERDKGNRKIANIENFSTDLSLNYYTDATAASLRFSSY